MDDTPAAESISLEANLPLPSSAREKPAGSSRRINVLKVATIMVVVAIAGCIFAGVSEMKDGIVPPLSQQAIRSLIWPRLAALYQQFVMLEWLR
jgi:hypothetical protein